MTRADSSGAGLRAVLVATAVAGISGYAIQLLAPALLTSQEYVAFSVLWSTLFLGGAAISGVQQEVARSVHPRAGGGGGRLLVRFALGAGMIVAAVATLVAVALGNALLPGGVVPVAVALVIGFAGYLATSVLTGVFYGLHLWAGVAFSVIADAILRVLLVVVGLALGWSLEVLALCVSVPFGLAAASAWLIFRRRLVRSLTVDVGLRRLVAHVAGTVVAAGGSGVMISGLPMVMGLTSRADGPATAALLLAITVTRAPIVIPVIALQSFLISTVFRGGTVRPARIVRFIGLLALAGVGLAGFGWLLGPAIIDLISSGRFALTALEGAVIVFSAVIVAGMCVTGPALIALRRHTANAAGWAAAAVLTIVLLVAGGDAGVAAALLVAPAAGLVIHVGVLLRHPSDDPVMPPPRGSSS